MSPERYIFRRQRKWYSSPFLIFVLTGMILSGLFVTQGYRRGEVQPLFLPTPTPTRVAGSFELEAETHFLAGNLDAAIASYEQAISVNPQNGRLYANLARILTYSTELRATDDEKQARFDQALAAAKKGTEVSPDDSTTFAVYAFSLDWYASFLRYNLQQVEEADKLLTEAEQMISKAITLDETNVLAQVFRAEIMIDQQRWDQAQSSIRTALERDPDLWDAHRVNGLFLENQGYYLDSIEEFKNAVRLAPNLTFLYNKLGRSYRSLAMNSKSEELSNQLFAQAIDYYAKAAELNEQLGIKDPGPYLGIGRTYGQLGEFFIASRNMNKALQYDPANPDVYAQLGMFNRQARNYEDALAALKCGVLGCNADESCYLRQCNPDADPAITIQGMPLSGATIVYYYSYASLLAGMYLPRDPVRKNYCAESTAMIRTIRASSFASDPTIGSILDESELMCRNMLSTPAVTLVAPTPTATAGPVYTPTRNAPTRTPAPENP